MKIAIPVVCMVVLVFWVSGFSVPITSAQTLDDLDSPFATAARAADRLSRMTDCGDALLVAPGDGLANGGALRMIADDDDPPAVILADFENGIGCMQDMYANDIGFVTWGDQPDNITLGTVAAEGDLALPDQVGKNTILKIQYNIADWGGFTHVLNDGENWTPQDWSHYTALEFWLYGTDSGSTIQIEIFDNRGPGSTDDSAERWFYRIPDEFVGWHYFSIPFADFARRSDWQPDGAPDDGLGLTEVHGYAFSFPPNVGPQTTYIDDIGLAGAAAATQQIPNTPPVPVPTVYSSSSSDGEWELVWRDEFDAEGGTPIDDVFWTCENGGHGWGNDQLEYDTDRVENVAHDGAGNLVITAREESYRGNAYTSARCTTRGKAEFTYGKIEARIDLPQGQGIWPAFWMLGADLDWPNNGEIDIMEYIGKEPFTIYGTIHGPGYSGEEGISGSYGAWRAVADDYHIFGIEWEPGVVRWYVDGALFHTVTPDSVAGHTWVFDQAFYLIINVAVGGTWPGNPDSTSVFPQQMLIDWIRVYQRAEDR